MCKLSEAICSGAAPALLYADDSASTVEMRTLLKSVGAKFEEEDARAEHLQEPVLVVGGSFLDVKSVREILRS